MASSLHLVININPGDYYENDMCLSSGVIQISGTMIPTSVLARKVQCRSLALNVMTENFYVVTYLKCSGGE